MRIDLFPITCIYFARHRHRSHISDRRLPASSMSTASAAAGPAAPCPSPGVLKHSYVFWNNKGGVGKTTLCFHVASQFAECNPLTNVLVLDMCPQASVSLTLLTKYVCTKCRFYVTSKTNPPIVNVVWE